MASAQHSTYIKPTSPAESVVREPTCEQSTSRVS
jgi:hypothetical protein